MVLHQIIKKPVHKPKSGEKVGVGIASLLNAAKELKTKLSHTHHKKQHT